jgi:hypothetical protein
LKISRFEALKYGGIRNTSFENMEVLGTLKLKYGGIRNTKQRFSLVK